MWPLFMMFQAQKTSIESIRWSDFLKCFFPTTAMATHHHPYVSTCGIDEKLSKWWAIQLAAHCRVHKLKYLYNHRELCISSSMHS